ncbi:energy transducer TonB [uncultured Tenacibaculum sp.]|uniref:energy transducer TonB n=1 Tax=uncultured Tenacibaculum sp. TaxID=174713 RepID=UPI0026395C0C|nr:energy transducer TonB [uncultured Tenacibaculum sp.]
MKKFKKNPKKQLEKFSTIFMQLGLVAVLFIVYITLEYKTELIKEPIDTAHNDNPPTLVFAEIPTLIKRVEKVTEKPKQRQQRTTIIEEPEIIDNDEKDFVETEIVNDIDDVVEIGEDDIVEVVEEEEIKKEDGPVSMKLVQKAPIFKGCEGLSESKARACFEKSMKRLVQRHFNTDLANDLGLQRGKNRIITQFVIDEDGLITDIQIRAPHPRLKKETNRIIKKIPKFKPGIQNNQKAKVRYTLPIGFMVE